MPRSDRLLLSPRVPRVKTVGKRELGRKSLGKMKITEKAGSMMVTEARNKQEAHHQVGLGETPRRFVLKRCRYSSLKKFEDAFDTALGNTALYLTEASRRMQYFSPFPNLDKCRPEAGGDVISGVTLDYVGTDVPAGLGDSRLNSGRTIRLFVRAYPFCALLCSI